jgi:hypothetical protein
MLQEYLNLRTDYTIILQSSFLLFLMYLIGLDVKVVYAFTLFYVYVCIVKREHPAFYSWVNKCLLLFFGMCIIYKLATMCKITVNNADELRVMYDLY